MNPYYQDNFTTLYNGDVLAVLPELPSESVNCVVTSPPYYGLRDYGVDGQIGLEPTPQEYIEKLVMVFREVRRVLKDAGTLWLNLGDSYSGSGKGGQSESKRSENWQPSYPKIGETARIAAKTKTAGEERNPDGFKPKDLMLIPHRVAIALQSDGWFVRSDIVWAKPNPMPESVTDRPTKAHEYVFLLSKSEKYYYDAEAIKESSVDPIGSANRYESAFGGSKADARIAQGLVTTPKGMREFSGSRNARSVWTIATEPYREAHFAVMPSELVRRCVMAGCPQNGVVLDPFVGSGTVLEVARNLSNRSIGIDLNANYCELIRKRLKQGAFNFEEAIA